MSEVVLRNPFEGGAVADPVRVKAYEKACLELKAEISKEDKSVIDKQTNKLKEYHQHISEIKKKIDASCEECDKNINTLRQEAQKNAKILKDYELNDSSQRKQEKYRNTIGQLESQLIANCKKRIELAGSINFKAISEIEIDDRKSNCNQVFKWIMVTIYQEAETKYYWPNFQQQALLGEAATDLKERLGKVNALQAKEEHRVKTNAFIEAYDKDIRPSPEFQQNNVLPEIDKIRDIAVLFGNSIEIGKKIQENQKLIEASKKQSQESDQSHIKEKAKNEAMQDRIKILEIYEKQVKNLKEILTKKEEAYISKVAESEKLFRDEELIVEHSYKPTESLEQEKRDNCQCVIY